MEKLRIEGLVKEFPGNVQAVNNVSLSAEQGEFLVLLGPSGCGKTTLLRCVAGFEEPNSGRIMIGDRVVVAPQEGISVPPEHRNLGMVFQSYAIWPHMTVFQNVAYGLHIRRRPQAEIRERVHRVLKLVNLQDLSERYPAQLSGGQQQRVALARSLVTDPQLLLLDEPLSNLDARLRDRLRYELREIQVRTNVTAVYVTHDQAEAVVLGDKVAVMNSGMVEQYTDPATLYRSPSTRFVAEFLGASNLFPAKVEAVTEEGSWVQVQSEGIPLLLASDKRFATGQEVGVSLRAECLRLSNEPVSDLNTWVSQASNAIYLGTQTQYELTAGDTAVNALALGVNLQYKVGENVHVHIAPADIAVFAK